MSRKKNFNKKIALGGIVAAALTGVLLFAVCGSDPAPSPVGPTPPAGGDWQQGHGCFVSQGNCTPINSQTDWNNCAAANRKPLGDPSCVAANMVGVLVDVTPAGAGSVTLSPPGGSYAPGTSVTATAVPSGANFQFNQWSSGSSTNPLVFTVNAQTSLTAMFTAVQVDPCAGGATPACCAANPSFPGCQAPPTWQAGWACPPFPCTPISSQATWDACPTRVPAGTGVCAGSSGGNSAFCCWPLQPDGTGGCHPIVPGGDEYGSATSDYDCEHNKFGTPQNHDTPPAAATEFCLWGDNGDCWGIKAEQGQTAAQRRAACARDGWIFTSAREGDGTFCLPGGVFTGEGKNSTPPTQLVGVLGCCDWGDGVGGNSTSNCYNSTEASCNVGTAGTRWRPMQCNTSGGTCPSPF